MPLAQGQPGAAISTLLDYLKDRQPLFHEKGLSAVWNELKRIGETALAAYTGDVEAIDLVDDLDPDAGIIAPSTAKVLPDGTRQVDFLTGFET